jgi:hypothetical protein
MYKEQANKRLTSLPAESHLKVMIEQEQQIFIQQQNTQSLI